MRPAVAAAFTGFTAQFEGIVPEMYTDVLGLVTTGIGNLIDPVAAALYLPWTRRSDGGLASAAEVAAEWGAVKTGKLAWYPRRAPRPLFLTSAAVSALVARRLNANEVFLAKRWPNWAQWPADAQLAAHSCAWAAGPAWHAPAFDTAVGQLHFYTCAGAQGDAGADPSCRGEAWLNDTGNPGLRPRNLANKALFTNAAVVILDGYDPDTLVWPTQLDG
jgi:hypothetical protein